MGDISTDMKIASTLTSNDSDSGDECDRRGLWGYVGIGLLLYKVGV
jgi:hypothetical protein